MKTIKRTGGAAALMAALMFLAAPLMLPADTDAIKPWGQTSDGTFAMAENYLGGTSGAYVPLAGGSDLGDVMTGTLNIGSSGGLNATRGLQVSLNRTPAGNSITAAAEFSNYSASNGATYPGYGLISSYNFGGASTYIGSGFISIGYASPDVSGFEARSELSASAFFRSQDDANTSPTVVISCFDDGVDAQTPASTKLLSFWNTPDDPTSEVAYVRGDGLFSGAAGLFSTQLVSPALTSGLTGTPDLTLSAVSTGKILLNDGVRLAAGSTQTITGVGNSVTAANIRAVLDPDGDYTLTSTPTIADGGNGDLLYVCASNGEANTVTFQDEGSLAGSNLQLGAATRAVSGKDMLVLMFDGTDWIEVSFANN